MRGGYRPGAGRKPLSIEERQAKREARNAARRTTLRENPPHRDPRSWAEKVPEGFKRGLSNQAMRALIALGNAPAVMNRDRPEFNPFKLPDFPPSVVPKDTKLRLAMDDALCETQNWASTQWAGFQWAGLASEGLVFPGYAYLSNLAIRPEYRIASETIADEMTRKWIKFRGVGENPAEEDDDDADDLDAMDREIQNDLKKRAKKGQGEFKPSGAKTADKSERIKELVDFMDHLGVKDAYYNAEMGGGLFGRMHLFHEIAQNDGSTPEGLKELMTDLGDGRGSISKSKVGPDSPLTGIRAIEPIWTYPNTYNALNPLRRDWYNPQIWYTQGQEIHVSRLFRLVPRPVPDLLKPSFSFGGLSLTQMMTPYVDIWLQTRAAIARLIQSFSCMVLSTDLQATLQDPNMGASVLMARVQAANATRGNQGLWVLNKATETLENVSASLAGLHELQAQSQEHLLSVTRIPAVKYTGIQPTGLNASSEGEIKVFEDTIVGMQERNFRGHLTRTVRFCMLSLWGEVDEDIVFDFVPLRELTEKEQAEVQKLKAETWDLLMNGTQSIGPTDVRKQLAADPDSGFDDIDPEEEPDIPEPVNPEGGKLDLKGNTGFGGGPDASKEGGAKDQNPFGLDEWNEDDHPRAPDGKFGSGSGSAEKNVPRVVSSRKMQQAVLRNTWARHGRDLDYDDVWETKAGDALWTREVQAWNEAHGTTLDPDRLDLYNGEGGKFAAEFDQKYLAGKKAPFPGARAANEYFENDGQRSLTAYLPGQDPEEER